MYNKRIKPDERPVFPKRALITGGMPYGNKELHFGHVGGMYIHADVFARFLRDRIGKENVIFVSGTDCYGSPALESYRKLKEEGYDRSIRDYVNSNHEKQKETLDKYKISLDYFGASALGDSKEEHNRESEEIFMELYKKGRLEKLSTPQFYDEEMGIFLNGRQVVGRCPIEGCQSEKAYADECSLGHQYMPSELIDPVSVVSGKKPSFKNVTNWYYRLEDDIESLKEYTDALKRESNTRKFELTIIDDFLQKPLIHIPKKYMEEREITVDDLVKELPECEVVDEEKRKSVTVTFKSLDDRDVARKVLEGRGIHYTAGKTLVPFRLTGNVEWGVPVPDIEDTKDLTFWVWPESLWAPISFTKAYLRRRGLPEDEWEKWWNDDEAQVYQFIGEDNIYFYAIAEIGMFNALGNIKPPQIIANRHVLFMDTKASSSSDIKPPMADELLDHYSADQLRMHFISLGLNNKSTGFKPLVYMSDEEKKECRGVDMVLKEGNLLTNVYNRLIRSCFYTTQNVLEGHLPDGEVSEDVKEFARSKTLEYERHMYNQEFHRISYVLDDFIRDTNKRWAAKSREADRENDTTLWKQLLIDTFYSCKVMAVLLHPLAPDGCEMFMDYMNIEEDKRWSWDLILEPLSSYFNDISSHELKFLEPRVDFFKKPQWQFGGEKE
ncbi:MAG: class I tRNA ligase family protein [Lachnospiraceae bacterium]|nr:class I tRNA ligase family protein [Lachnospiraceae bacterium]